MPLVIQASLSVAGETWLPHHWWAMVLAKRRVLPRSGRMATISGAQAAETESAGSSTTFELAGLGGAEGAGEELELLGDGDGEVVGLVLVGFGGEDADVGDAGSCDWVEELAGDDGAGEAGAASS